MLCETFLRHVTDQPKMKTRKLGVTKKFVFAKMVQDYGNRSADISVVMQAVGQAGIFSLSEYYNLYDVTCSV